MKSKFIVVLLLLFSAFSLFAMGNKESSDDRLLVVTSFYPMYDFTKKVAGDSANVVNLVPSGTEPHDWEPSTRDLLTLEKADVFIYSGRGMEHWVSDVLTSLNRSDLIVVEAGKDVSLLESSTSHGEADPHIWLDVKNAIKEMSAIKDSLIKADSVNASYYNQNYNHYLSLMSELGEEFIEKLKPYKGESIVVSHEAFGYLCSAYGLVQVGIDGLEPEGEPEPERMAYIQNFVKEHNVKTIFSAELVNSKVATAIASETGAKVAFLSPLEGLSDEEARSGGDDISVMKENLKALLLSFEGEIK